MSRHFTEEEAVLRIGEVCEVSGRAVTILVDKNKRIRGFYDGTNLDQPTNDPKTKNMKQLLEDILWLCENQ